MLKSCKPVRRCHRCLLNQKDHCWGYSNPRVQWRNRGTCPAFENETLYAQFRDWEKQARAKTRRELRQEARGTPRPSYTYHLEAPARSPGRERSP